MQARRRAKGSRVVRPATVRSARSCAAAGWSPHPQSARYLRAGLFRFLGRRAGHGRPAGAKGAPPGARHSSSQLSYFTNAGGPGWWHRPCSSSGFNSPYTSDLKGEEHERPWQRHWPSPRFSPGIRSGWDPRSVHWLSSSPPLTIHLWRVRVSSRWPPASRSSTRSRATADAWRCAGCACRMRRG